MGEPYESEWKLDPLLFEDSQVENQRGMNGLVKAVEKISTEDVNKQNGRRRAASGNGGYWVISTMKKGERRMLLSVKEIQRYSIYAADGDVGSVEEFYFDDETWRVRYLVAKAGGLLLNRQVLIAPEFVKEMDRDTQILYTNLTKEQVENSPSIEADRPVANQQEVAYYDYYGAASYWGSGWEAAGIPAYVGPPYPGMPGRSSPEGEDPREKPADPHLRSMKEVIGYGIRATDGEIGHAEDFMVDDEEWAIRYVAVDTRDWLPGGKKVLISPQWISRVSLPQKNVFVDLVRDEIESAPEWDPEAPVDREYETRLHEHYSRPPY